MQMTPTQRALIEQVIASANIDTYDQHDAIRALLAAHDDHKEGFELSHALNAKLIADRDRLAERVLELEAALHHPSEAMLEAGIAAMFDRDHSNGSRKDFLKVMRKGCRAMAAVIAPAASPGQTAGKDKHG